MPESTLCERNSSGAAHFASEHVKVVLGGDGGDEIFAEFDRYVAFGWVSRYGWAATVDPRGCTQTTAAWCPGIIRLQDLRSAGTMAARGGW